MNKQTLNLITSATLILFIGLTAGYSMGYFRRTRNNFPQTQFINEINEGVVTIKLMEVKNGKIYGEIEGKKGRIAYNSNNIITIQEGESFEIPINEINLKNYYQAKNLPEKAQFIASKQGKYYYSIFDKSALNIIEKNRIYFSSESEAEKMGYFKK